MNIKNKKRIEHNVGRRIVLFFLFLSVLTKLGAYNKPLVINFNKEQYRGDNKNWSVSQDSRGVMYFGNDMGLLEFDGIDWQLHRMSNGLIVRSVAAKSHETIFTGGYEEFGRWDRDISGKLIYTSLSGSIDNSLFKNDDFWKIIVLDNLVYFQSFSSIYVYDYKTVQRLNSDRLILFLSKVRDKLLVQGMQYSLFELQGSDLREIEGSEVLRGTDVCVILPYGEDKYLIGTVRNGVYIYDGKRFTEWDALLSQVLKGDELNCAALSLRGTYYLGTILNGIYEVDKTGKIINHISSASKLQNNTVLSLFEDNVGNLWAALDRGISYIRYLKNMSSYTDLGGNTGAVYDAVLWDDRLFLGTNQGVFFIDNDNLGNANSLSNMKLVAGTQGQVWSFSVVDGRLFYCHNKGLGEIKSNLQVVDPYNIGIGVFRLTETKIKGRDMLVLSTYSSVRMIDKITKEVFVLELSEPIINTAVDHLDNLWVEHANKGVYKCQLSADMKRFTTIKHYGGDTKEGLPYKLKLFKVGGRIVLLGDGHFYTYDDISDQIILNEKLNACFQSIKNIKQVIHIKDTQFWALTGTTAYKFTYDGYKAFIDESCNISIGNLSMVNMYENISVLNDSTNLICLDNGFLLYNVLSSAGETQAKKLAMPYIESIQTSNIKGDQEYWQLAERAEISFSHNTITFRFLANNVFSDNLYFQFQLQDIDVDWSDIQKTNEVTYAGLPQGSYTFLVRTVDNLGNVSAETSYEFEIRPPWYFSVWAYIVYVIAFVLLIIAIWLMIVRHYAKINRKRERIWEAGQLRMKNDQLQNEIEKKDAEMFTQTSFIIQKNELILKLKGLVDDFYSRSNSQALAPLYQKINAVLNNNLDTDEDWKMFLIKFEQKHANFFKILKNKYTELTNNDLKLCACLKLNLDTKEIASLMNLSVRAVENSRYRLRKKLNIQPTQNLNDFFLEFD